MGFHCGRLSSDPGWKHLFIHYTWFAAVCTITGLKTFILLSLLMEEGFTVHCIMSYAHLFPCMCAASFGIGNVLKAKEAVQLVNSWKGTLTCLQEPKGRVVSEYEDLTLSLKVIGVTCTIVAGGPFLVSLSFMFPNLPVSLHNLLPRFGVGCSVPQIALQICFIPAELLFIMQPLLSTGFGVAVLMIGIDVLKVYYEQLR